MKWIILLSILCCIATMALAQRVDHNNNLTSAQSYLDILGGDPHFFIRCLQSDLGGGEHPTKSTWTWRNIDKKSWSPQKCTLKAIVSFSNEDRPYSEEGIQLDENRVAHLTIQCKDASGKDLLLEKTKSLPLIRCYIEQQLFEKFATVNTPKGINVRQSPSTSSPIIGKASNGSKVIVLNVTDQTTEIKEGTKTIKTKWVKVYLDKDHIGYVVDAFLIPWNQIVPDRLYAMEFRSKEVEDTVKLFLPMQLVDKETYDKRRVPNPYTIDGLPLAKKGPTKRTERGDLFDSFYLPINKGKDSILIQDEPAEYVDIDYSYEGRILPIQQYVVMATFFDTPGRHLYDMRTGQKHEFFSNGHPYFSPDGIYVVDFYQVENIESPDVLPHGFLQVNRVDKALKTTMYYSANFEDWVAEDAFWISNKEVILVARNFVPTTKVSYQYIKLTLP